MRSSQWLLWTRSIVARSGRAWAFDEYAVGTRLAERHQFASSSSDRHGEMFTLQSQGLNPATCDRDEAACPMLEQGLALAEARGGRLDRGASLAVTRC